MFIIPYPAALSYFEEPIVLVGDQTTQAELTLQDIEKIIPSKRLVISPQSPPPPLKMLSEGLSGALQTDLIVNSNGTVRSADNFVGSRPMLFHLKKYVSTIKFKPTDSSDQGPWKVSLILFAKQTQHGSHFEAIATGRSASQLFLKFVIKTVDSLPPTQ